MKMRCRSVAIAAGLILAAASIYTAHARGLFVGYPIIGGASYCEGSSVAGVPGTSGVCNSTVPAGPSSLTGDEKFAADTKLASGQNPQTVLVPTAALNALPPAYFTVDQLTSTTASTTLTNNTGCVIVLAAGTVSATQVTIQAPPAPINNQRFCIDSNRSISTLLVSPNTGQTVSTGPTALTISTTGAYGYEFIYRASNTTWYRLR